MYTFASFANLRHWRWFGTAALAWLKTNFRAGIKSLLIKCCWERSKIAESWWSQQHKM